MLKSRYFMKIDWNIFREKRCLHCLSPFTAQADGSLLHKHIHTHLCPQCAAELAEMKSGFCLHCGQALSDPKAAPVRCGQCGGTADLWQSFAFYMQYSSVFRELILKAKFNENRACAKFLGELLAYLVLERFPDQRKFDVLPMPLHSRRLIKRGYNQCLEILKFFKICLEKFRTQTVYMILGMMLGSFYAIIMGPTTLEVPQKALSLDTFSIIAAAVGLILVLGLQLIKDKSSASR